MLNDIIFAPYINDRALLCLGNSLENSTFVL